MMTGLLEIAARVRIDRAAVVMLVITGIIGLVGTVVSSTNPVDPWLGLDGEITVTWPREGSTIAIPALWSSLLLLGAGATWLVASLVWPGRRSRWLLVGFAALLLYGATDEAFFWHERLEARTGVDWQILYAPLALLAAMLLAALLVKLRRRDRLATVLLMLGVGSWVVAQLLEYLQWDGDTKAANYFLLMVPEEIGENLGSVLILVAGLRLLKVLAIRSLRDRERRAVIS